MNDVTNTWTPERDVLDLKENKIGGGNLSSYDYRMNVNDLGQRTGVDTSGSAFWGNERDRSWGYDLMGQLTVENDLVNNAYDRGFAFDRIGNRTASIAGSTNPAGVGAITYTPNALNEYAAIADPAATISTPQYDDDGNTTSSSIRPNGLPGTGCQVATYAWDAENRLIEIRQPNNTLIASYKYDAYGRRIATSRLSYPSLVVWMFDGWNPIVKYYGSFPSEIYLWGLDVSGTLQGAGGVGGLLAVSMPGIETFYPTFDGNGNVSECIATNYGIDVHYEYDAFGNVINTSGWFSQYFPFRFSTKQQDEESGLLYYGYRYYDPLTGRWPSRDPIGETGGVNLYGFVGNDGIWRIDLLGLDKIILNIAFMEPDADDTGLEVLNWSTVAGFWASAQSALPNIESFGFPDFHNNDKDRSAKYWNLMQKRVEEHVGEDDCIVKVIIRGHGNSSENGGMNADQMLNKQSPQYKFFEWLKTKKCEGNATMELMTCYAAQDNTGRENIKNIAISSGFQVVAFDDQYALVGWGNQWTANPDGTWPKLTKTGGPFVDLDKKDK